jgi:hypothetical protein
MEIKTELPLALLERAEQYSKTSIELIKLKALDKTADVASALYSRLMVGLVMGVSVFILNIAIALWLGEIFGKIYYGFLLVASFYALLGFVLLATQSAIKSSTYNSILAQNLSSNSCKQ